MAIQPIDTQRWIPWKESVTITSVRPNSANVVEVYPSAGVYKLGGGEAAPSFGVHTKYDIKVTIATDGVTFTPKPRDTVLWKGDTYTVLSIDGSDWQKFWILTARNLVLAEDLRSTGVLSRPSNAQDSAGRASLATYADVATGIPCRVQSTDNRTTDVFERKTMPNACMAYLGQQVEARAKDRFVANGVTYSVLAVHNPERLDALMSLELEQIL